MSVVAAPPSRPIAVPSPAAAAAPARLPTPFPSREALALEATSRAGLETIFQNGSMPDLEGLVGWEFRGINRLPLNFIPFGQLVGIKKFLKGFFRGGDGRVMGYNSPVDSSNALDGRWNIKPKKFGFYEVHEVDATARDNEYLHALLLDYGKGGNKPYDVTRGLRDYLVQVSPDNPDLLLGKAYFAVGPARIGALNFFILERHRRGLTDYASR
ncbi:MAG: hypothetical protein H0T46_28075 [Deltaproteobacteria bacterium]|nr:hypothetical protein [Deltaproteobacteria bacterium]